MGKTELTTVFDIASIIVLVEQDGNTVEDGVDYRV